MSESKHTAAPWEVAGNMVRTAYRMGDPEAAGVMVADCGTYLPERAANARLIAAAPELLEALRAARQTVLDLKNSRWSEAEGSDEEWVAEIDAAIAKATGETA